MTAFPILQVQSMKISWMGFGGWDNFLDGLDSFFLVLRDKKIQEIVQPFGAVLVRCPSDKIEPNNVLIKKEASTS